MSDPDDKTPPERPMRKRHHSQIPGAVPSPGGGYLVPTDPKKENEWAEEQPKTDPGFKRSYKKYNRRSMGVNAALATALSAALSTGIAALSNHQQPPAPGLERLSSQVNDHEFRIRRVEDFIGEVRDDVRFIRNRLTGDYVDKKKESK